MLPILIVAALVAPAPEAKPATNTTCPVTGEKVTAKSPKVVVKGQTYFICCKGCDKAMLKDPDKYLNADGTPKNAKK
jgi:YHS domain-containing protein